MTEVMSFFQTMFMFKSSAPVIELKTAEVKLAVALKAEALELAAVADEEMQNGRRAQSLSETSHTSDKRRAFAEIAVWHNNRAAEKYTKAAARFEEAGRVHIKKIEGFNKRADEMRRRAAEAKVNMRILQNLLKQF